MLTPQIARLFPYKPLPPHNDEQVRRTDLPHRSGQSVTLPEYAGDFQAWRRLFS
jgi:hypothetical protein